MMRERKGFFYPAASVDRVPLVLKGMRMGIQYVLAMPVKNISPFWKYQKLKTLKPQPTKFLFNESGSSDNTLELLKDFPNSELITTKVAPDWSKTAKTSYDNVAKARQQMLMRARQLKPECLLMLDADTVSGTPDLVPRMEYRHTDIVGGAYLRVFEDGMPSLAAYWPNGVRKQQAIYPFDDTVYVVGGGCMLISNRLLMDEDVNFFPVPTDGTSEDYAYCQRAREKGYTIGLDSSVLLLHYYDDEYGDKKDWSVKNIKTPDGLKKTTAWGQSIWLNR